MHNTSTFDISEVLPSDKIDRVEILLIELQKKKTVCAVLDHFGNQYYIYGQQRGWLMSWAAPLRNAVERDAYHFTQCDNDAEYERFMERHGRDQFHFTRRVLTNVFNDVSEYSAYVVEEAEQMDVILDVLKQIYYNWKRNEFKAKLAGDGEISTW